MAGDADDSDGLAGATHEPRECMACRGSGRVISNLGGTPSAVTCPWCDGSGLRPAAIDAQARWAAPAQEPGPSSGSDAPDAATPAADVAES